MRLDDQRRSSNFEDRGRGAGGGMGGGGVGAGALFGLMRVLGLRGMVVVGLLLAVVYFVNPFGLRTAIFGGALGGSGGQAAQGSGQVCETQGDTCVMLQRVLASTEDVWRTQFQSGHLPNYGHPVSAYEDPTLAVFTDGVETGCGAAQSAMGPFYCPSDRKLYIDPSFYQVMAERLNSPGDFAQAYVIAHEVGHHVQNLIGATDAGPQGETQNQHSVRVELQADCFAGVWGASVRSRLQITDEDLREALNAAHNIGDDTLQRQSGGGVNESAFTHGSSDQRMRWFRRGFDTGDARQCDTMAVGRGQL